MSSCSRWPLGAGGHVDASNQTEHMRTNRAAQDRSIRARERQQCVFKATCLLFLYDAPSAMREQPRFRILPDCLREASPAGSAASPSPAAGDCNSPINAFLMLTDVTKW